MSTPPGQAPSGAADPSMEDILASIRRILSEDEAEPAQPQAAPEPAPAAPPAATPDVLALDPSMLVDEPTQPAPAPPPPLSPAALPTLRAEPALPALHAQHAPEPPPPAPPAYPPPAVNDWPADPPRRQEALLAPEASAAAVSSMGSLLRTLIAERQQVPVHRGGPSIEDVVREEVRPLLKQWLDANLPPLVERLVRTEIERVVGRALS